MDTKLVIVGGVAGGASAATRARRIDEKARIVLFEKGPYISFANCGLPYHVGGEIRDREDLLVTTPEVLEKRFNIDVRVYSEVTAIHRDRKMVAVKDHRTGETYEESYDKLILSPGASPVRPVIPGVDSERVFTLRSIPDADLIRDFIVKKHPSTAVVAGGGFIGIEMAENLVQRGIRVILVEALDQVLPFLDYETASMVHRTLAENGIDLIFGERVTSFGKTDGDNFMVTTSGGREIPADFAILAVGVRPDTSLAVNAELELGALGGILTDEYMRTSDPDIFAVGDAVEVRDYLRGDQVLIPLAGPANKQGRIAADNALGRRVKFRGVQGTSIVKVFNTTAASTGANEKLLKKLGHPHMVSYSTSGSHASYYPGSTTMTIKLVFEPDSGRVLGAQIVGQDGVDKRIDVLATAIRGNMTVFDLEELELAYAPPFSSARDPVNVAGFVAANILRGDMKVLHWNEIDLPGQEEYRLLDVRTDLEIELTGKMPGALHVPLDDLRIRLEELPREEKYLVYCGTGLRSYAAQRILAQSGYDAYNLGGGYTLMTAVRENSCLNSRGISPQHSEMITEEKSVSMDRVKIDYEVNACGIQCPGPIMKLKGKLDEMSEGQVVSISATESGFTSDVSAWCANTGNDLVSLVSTGGVHTALVRKGKVKGLVVPGNAVGNKKKTLVLFSNDLDRAMAAFIIANGAAAMGNDVTIFFTFWGLNVLRKKQGSPVKKDFLSKMFGMMMPKGPEKLTLSKLNMAGMGTEMMKYVMKNKNVDTLDELIRKAQDQGVRFVGCTMTMEVMGLSRDELIDGVEEGGVATFLNSADESNASLFI